MATLEERFEWLKEILEEKPERFSDYFKEDFILFIENNKIDITTIKKDFGGKYESFIKCETKEEIKDFVDKLISFVLKYSNTEDLIFEYFS